MSYNLGIKRLRQDICEDKQIALFLGAGINSSPEINLMWNQLLNPIFRSALYKLSFEYGFSKTQLDALLDLFGIQKMPEFDSEPKHRMLKENVVFEYNPTVRAMLVKAILGKQYIPVFQERIYSQCDKTIMRKAFKSYALKADEEYKPSGVLYTLYTVARLILLNNNVKGVVTYNYDNFLTHAINILQDSPELYFCQRDIESAKTRLSMDRNKRLNVEDIYGKSRPDFLDNNTLFIYHPHGYIPSPSERADIDNFSIIMSQDEYCEDTTRVYSWNNDTQVHLLSHYTCLFLGSSISELSTQRMIHYARRNGNDKSLYYLNAVSKSEWADSPISTEANEALSLLKTKYYEACGLYPIICPTGYDALMHDINNIIEDRIKI